MLRIWKGKPVRTVCAIIGNCTEDTVIFASGNIPYTVARSDFEEAGVLPRLYDSYEIIPVVNKSAIPQKMPKINARLYYSKELHHEITLRRIMKNVFG